jgi:hypothetical protein
MIDNGREKGEKNEQQTCYSLSSERWGGRAEIKASTNRDCYKNIQSQNLCDKRSASYSCFPKIKQTHLIHSNN